MNLKKAVCMAISTLFFGMSFCCNGVSALYGNSHYNIGKKITEKLDEKLSQSEKEAFLAGVVYADIGRFKFDKEITIDKETGEKTEKSIDSDSDEFAKKIKELAKTKEEKWFAAGFEVHVLQDKKTKSFLKEIFEKDYSSYSEYMSQCGALDMYFSKKSGILYNEFLNKFNFDQIAKDDNFDALTVGVPKSIVKYLTKKIIKKYSDYPQKNELVMYEDLIKRTYKSLGYDVDLEDIYEQAGNLLGSFIVIAHVMGNKEEISEKTALKIEEQSEKLADLCLSECIECK